MTARLHPRGRCPSTGKSDPGQRPERRRPPIRASTQSSYRQTYQLAVSLGDFPSVGAVGTWVTWLRGRYPPPEGCTDSWTVHLHWHNLAALYSWAKKWGFAAGCNPAAALDLKKPTARARAIVDIAELWPALLGACHDLRERTFLQAARDFGVRRGELLGLMPHDLVTLGEPWRMRFERQRPRPNEWNTTPLKKNGANRSLPVTLGLRAMLVDLLALGAPKVWTGVSASAAARSRPPRLARATGCTRSGIRFRSSSTGAAPRPRRCRNSSAIPVLSQRARSTSTSTPDRWTRGRWRASSARVGQA